MSSYKNRTVLEFDKKLNFVEDVDQDSDAFMLLKSIAMLKTNNKSFTGVNEPFHLNGHESAINKELIKYYDGSINTVTLYVMTSLVHISQFKWRSKTHLSQNMSLYQK